jgi:LemA protein
MRVVLGRNSKANRKEQLQRILGSEQPDQRGRVHTVRRYVGQHLRMLVAALVVAAVAATQIYYFNLLTGMKQEVTSLRAQIESGLQMRQNIIPSLTAAVNRFMSYEKHVFLSAVDSRENALSMSEDMDRLIESLKEISGRDVSPSELSKFMAVAENYPQLVSIESYKLLIAQIADVEKQLYNKRLEYNDTVRRYNSKLSTFPANLAGKMMGFSLEPYFGWDKKPEWAFPADPEWGEPSSFRMEPDESGPGE